MPDGAVETVTIAQAAALLGVHRNTVRNRIKAGRYRAYKVVTPQGETFAVERDSLGLPPHNHPANGSHAQVRHNPTNGAQTGALAADAGQAQQFAVVQRLLAPFVEDLARTHAELGRVQERLAVTERERDELRAEVERLRKARDAPAASPAAPGATEPTRPGSDAPRSWWRRVWWLRERNRE